jgi:hypothetical protein
MLLKISYFTVFLCTNHTRHIALFLQDYSQTCYTILKCYISHSGPNYHIPLFPHRLAYTWLSTWNNISILGITAPKFTLITPYSSVGITATVPTCLRSIRCVWGRSSIGAHTQYRHRHIQMNSSSFVLATNAHIASTFWGHNSYSCVFFWNKEVQNTWITQYLICRRSVRYKQKEASLHSTYLVRQPVYARILLLLQCGENCFYVLDVGARYIKSVRKVSERSIRVGFLYLRLQGGRHIRSRRCQK